MHQSRDSTNGISVLSLSPHYRAFSKGIIDGISKLVLHTDVILYHNVWTEVFQHLPMGKLSARIRENTRKNLIELPILSSNVRIYVADGPWGCLSRTSKEYGERLARLFSKTIIRNRIKFDLIHSHFIWPFGFIGSRLSKSLEKPLIITAHGYDIYDLPFRDDRWKCRVEEILNSAEFITTVSKANASYLEKLDIRTPYTIIPNGFDSKIFFPRAKSECRTKLGLPLNEKLIVAIGNLKVVKGHRYLIEAMRSVVRERNNTRCIIIGTGDQSSVLARLIENNNLKNHVTLIGSRPHGEIPVWINSSDIIAIPSLMEGSPTIMFESLACGKPIVASDVGGISEIIKNDRYGFLCRSGDSKDLSEKLIRAIEKDWDYNMIRRYAEEYSFDEIGKKYVSLFSEILHIS